jgi:NADPH-dependent 7-cyano-7-deazaguanine reductase QueF
MDIRVTRMQLPVLIGFDYQHVMAECVVTETPDKTEIHIEATGDAARYLGSFVASNEPVALSFVAIPVRNKHE